MLKKFSNKVTARKRGQTSVEYILIIGVVVGVIMVFGKGFRSKISTITEDLFSGVSTNINGSMNQ